MPGHQTSLAVTFHDLGVLDLHGLQDTCLRRDFRTPPDIGRATASVPLVCHVLAPRYACFAIISCCSQNCFRTTVQKIRLLVKRLHANGHSAPSSPVMLPLLVEPRAVFEPHAPFPFSHKIAGSVPLAPDSTCKANLMESQRRVVARAAVRDPRVSIAWSFLPFQMCRTVAHEQTFQDDCAIVPRFQFYTRAQFLPSSTRMTIGTDPHWDIARRLGKDLPHYDERILLTEQMGALEEQRSLFGGRQLEDGYSLARIARAADQ